MSGTVFHLEKEMATQSSTLAWEIPWTEKPGRIQSMGCKESDMTEQLQFQFAPWKKSYDQHSIFKIRDITLPTKVRLVKAMVFPVVMHGCESWTIKKTELHSIECFDL